MSTCSSFWCVLIGTLEYNHREIPRHAFLYLEINTDLFTLSVNLSNFSHNSQLLRNYFICHVCLQWEKGAEPVSVPAICLCHHKKSTLHMTTSEHYRLTQKDFGFLSWATRGDHVWGKYTSTQHLREVANSGPQPWKQHSPMRKYLETWHSP